jgi:hypothetical protein
MRRDGCYGKVMNGVLFRAVRPDSNRSVLLLRVHHSDDGEPALQGGAELRRTETELNEPVGNLAFLRETPSRLVG